LLGQVATGPMDISGLPQRQTSVATNAYTPTNLPNLPGVNSFGSEAKTAQDAVYNKAESMLQPQMDQARQSLVQTNRKSTRLNSSPRCRPTGWERLPRGRSQYPVRHNAKPAWRQMPIRQPRRPTCWGSTAWGVG